MSEKLKPCPFCGGEDLKVPDDGGNVWCRSCHAVGPGPIRATKSHKLNSEAVGRNWNRRENSAPKKCYDCGSDPSALCLACRSEPSPATSEQPVDDAELLNISYELGRDHERKARTQSPSAGGDEVLAQLRDGFSVLHGGLLGLENVEKSEQWQSAIRSYIKVVEAHLDIIDSLPSALPTAPLGGDLVERFANAVEKLAFEMPAPNPYTPRFVQMAKHARFAQPALTQPDESEVVEFLARLDPAFDSYGMGPKAVARMQAAKLLRALMARYNLVRKG